MHPWFDPKYPAGSIHLESNAFLISKDTGDTDHFIFGLNASDNLYLNAPSGKLFDFRIGNVRELQLSGSALFPYTNDGLDLGLDGNRFRYAYFSGATLDSSGLSLAGALITSDSSAKLKPDTLDGSDSKQLAILGGGDLSSGRGGYVAAHGNEHATRPGSMLYVAGNVGGDHEFLLTGASGLYRFANISGDLISIDYGGDLILNTTNGTIRQEADGSVSARRLSLYSGTSGSTSQGAIIQLHSTADGGYLDLYCGLSSKLRWFGDTGSPLMEFDDSGYIHFLWSMGDSTKDPTTDAPDDWVQVAINGSFYYIPAYAVS